MEPAAGDADKVAKEEGVRYSVGGRKDEIGTHDAPFRELRDENFQLVPLSPESSFALDQQAGSPTELIYPP